MVDAECRDTDVCTTDRCVNNKCVHVFIPPPQCCKTNADCNTGGVCPPQCVNNMCVVVPPPLEMCGNMTDDDCDGKIDCMDPDCANLPPCIHRDPSSIRFGQPGAGLDLFSSHGKIKLRESVDVNSQEIGWELSNAQGVIYRASLRPGDLTPSVNPMLFSFQDPGARVGQGAHGGLYTVLLIASPRGNVAYKVRAYGDLSAATLPDMALHFYIGEQAFGVGGAWRRTSRGWIAPRAPLQ